MAETTQGSAASMTAKVLPLTGEGKYRIALRHPDPENPNHTVFAWRKVYTHNPDFHAPGHNVLDDAIADLDTARGEFPGHDAWVEVLVDNGDETHSWVPMEDEEG